MLNVTKLAEWLQVKTAWQETPVVLASSDYIGMVIDGIERLFVDTGRALVYDENLYVTLEDESLGYDANIPLDERRYIQICSEMNFFAKVQSDVNNSFGYST